MIIDIAPHYIGEPADMVRGITVDADNPPAELVEDLARACFCEDAPGAFGRALDLVKEAHRNAARRILRALAEKVKA